MNRDRDQHHGGPRRAATKVLVTGTAIRLDQFLKWAGVVPTGGQAKTLVLTGCVTVNGSAERRRGRQLRPGDIVGIRRGAIGLELFEVVGSGPDGD